jgi:DNA-binding transcriptional ArsR family regulator
MRDGSKAPRLLWDWGTAYDLFVSQEVLHDPAAYGLRAKWAAGVRARVSPAEREILEEAQLVLFGSPLHWIYSLPAPKDGATALWMLRQIPPGERLAALTQKPRMSADLPESLREVTARGTWDEADRQALQDEWKRWKGEECRLSEKRLDAILKWWVRAEEFGERYLAALQSYHGVFFAEEEERIRPALQAAVARGQELAERLSLPDLLEELSQGLRITELPQVADWVLAPSFWSTPLVRMDQAGPDRDLWLFGARPADSSLVPGETVPDGLLLSLKALSDATRLRILRLVSEEPLIPAEIARRLRLRAQTVSHHLQILRLAGLVQVTLGEGEDKYGEPHAVRAEALAAAFGQLQVFLELGDDPDGSG